MPIKNDERQSFFFHLCIWIIPLVLATQGARSQDSTLALPNHVVTLKEVVVRNNLNVPAFIERIKNDTSFYKAFLNLKILGYTSLNDIRILDKEGAVKSSLASRTRQWRKGGCRWNQVLEERTTGDIYDSRHHWNYYTAAMYASLFFAPDTVCGETNMVAGKTPTARGSSGMTRHQEQLKMLFFSPGKKIPGIPFIGDRIALFDDAVSDRYDFIIDMGQKNGELCYIFKIVPRADLDRDTRQDIVIDEMTTWFRTSDWEIVARNYDLSYNTGIYDFTVRMEVEMTHYKQYLVPSLLRYDGNWKVLFKKREKALFTVTFFDFSEGLD
jgi:hypothetical protein